VRQHVDAAFTRAMNSLRESLSAVATTLASAPPPPPPPAAAAKPASSNPFDADATAVAAAAAAVRERENPRSPHPRCYPPFPLHDESPTRHTGSARTEKYPPRPRRRRRRRWRWTGRCYRISCACPTTSCRRWRRRWCSCTRWAAAATVTNLAPRKRVAWIGWCRCGVYNPHQLGQLTHALENRVLEGALSPVSNAYCARVHGCISPLYPVLECMCELTKLVRAVSTVPGRSSQQNRPFETKLSRGLGSSGPKCGSILSRL
jgi:hypothetical protein